VAPTASQAKFNSSSLGGRYVLLAFLPLPSPQRDEAIMRIHNERPLFDDSNLVAFGVLRDEASFKASRDMPHAVRWFFDPHGEIAKLYDAQDDQGQVAPRWVLIDPMMRILVSVPLDRGEELFAFIRGLGKAEAHAGTPLHAPVLIVPRVFEPDICKRLIAEYDRQGGQVSGVMREEGGMTVPVVDDFKRRRDANIEDPQFLHELRVRIKRRLLPEIRKAFQFEVTRMERYIVACYDAEEGGYFRPHRDNTSKGTAHRQFAVSINLNAEAFTGGDLCFPEFGQRTYRPPTGGAVVFSCSLLHEAKPVTSGRRYAFLPFLYDDAHAKIREENARFLVQNLQPAAG
jgi:predicted 2-oxoglutarate/Fe(II)-dependent dioxygenase YbiX